MLGEKLGIEIADEGGAAAVEVDGVPVVLQLAGDDILLLHVDIGEIAPDRRDAVAASALEANFLYQGTGGATLAVNPRDGHLHLQKYNWLDRLDAEKGFSGLTRFAETALAWRKLLHAPAAATDSHRMQV